MKKYDKNNYGDQGLCKVYNYWVGLLFKLKNVVEIKVNNIENQS